MHQFLKSLIYDWKQNVEFSHEMTYFVPFLMLGQLCKMNILLQTPLTLSLDERPRRI